MIRPHRWALAYVGTTPNGRGAETFAVFDCVECGARFVTSEPLGSVHPLPYDGCPPKAVRPRIEYAGSSTNAEQRQATFD